MTPNQSYIGMELRKKSFEKNSRSLHRFDISHVASSYCRWQTCASKLPVERDHHELYSCHIHGVAVASEIGALQPKDYFVASQDHMLEKPFLSDKKNKPTLAKGT